MWTHIQHSASSISIEPFFLHCMTNVQPIFCRKFGFLLKTTCRSKLRNILQYDDSPGTRRVFSKKAGSVFTPSVMTRAHTSHNRTNDERHCRTSSVGKSLQGRRPGYLPLFLPTKIQNDHVPTYIYPVLSYEVCSRARRQLASVLSDSHRPKVITTWTRGLWPPECQG